MLRHTLLACALVACAATAASAGGAWNVTIPQFASVAMSVSATGPETVVVPLADNGRGSFIVRSTDGGKTFKSLPNGNIGGMYLGGAAQGNSAVASNMFALYYSDKKEGYNFTNSKGVLGITSQSVEAFGGSSYAATGSTVIGKGNGVAVSTDGGARFTFCNVSELTTPARYGAFPSTSTWYLSAGQWPTNEAQTDGMALSQRVTLRADLAGNPRMDLELKSASGMMRASPGGNSTGSGWRAQIVKTEDGGKTWSSVFEGAGFYFNQIDCADENTCVAVGESDGTEGGSPGIRIYSTTDGGKTWKRTMYQSNPHNSIMAVRFSSPTEVWAAGGLMTQEKFTGLFFHSTDGGATWTDVSVDGVYTVGMSFASPSEGYAVSLNRESVTSFLTFRA